MIAFMSLLLIFGDSITWGAWDPAGGWVQRLRCYLEKNKNGQGHPSHHVYNLGINGNTSDEVLRRFEFEVQQRLVEEEDVLLIFAIGVNDSQLLIKESTVKMTIEQFNHNLEKILNQARRYTKSIIFVGLLPVVERKVTPVPRNTSISYKNNRIRFFNESLQTFCKSHAIYYIDLWDNWIKKDYSSMLEDGIHPNERGHQDISNSVKNFIFTNKLLQESKTF